LLPFSDAASRFSFRSLGPFVSMVSIIPICALAFCDAFFWE
jgi:hypothetical protein